MAKAAVIFDVDGVLLELTRDEEEIFFQALSKFVSTEKLSRDWNSYKIRNDEDIIAEILELNHLSLENKAEVIEHYVSLLANSPVTSVSIDGAAQLLESCRAFADLGIATANLRAAAKHRLLQAGFWHHVQTHAHGADGGGHKSTILARALKQLDLPPNRIVYVGDNTNDVDAGLQHGVHFIGFSTKPEQRTRLSRHGAQHISASHEETLVMINKLLA